MKKIITALILSSVCMVSMAGEVKSGLAYLNELNAKLDAEKVLTIRISHVVAAGAPKGKAVDKFKEIMEKKFPGRVKVEVHHNNSLFKDGEESEALDVGAIDVIIPTLGKTAGQYNVKEFGVFDLPFLFSSDDAVKKYVASPTGQKLLNMLTNKSETAEAVAYWPNAFRSFSGPVPFKSPTDLKPYGFRVESPSMANYYKSIGVKQVLQLPLAEVHAALKKEGDIKLDGAENPYSNFMGSKLFEVQKYLTVSRHSYNGYVFLANKRMMREMPADIKAGFVAAAKEAGEICMQISLSGEGKNFKDIQDKGVRVHNWTPAEKKSFKLSAIPVHEKFMIEVNKDFLLDTYKELKTEK